MCTRNCVPYLHGSKLQACPSFHSFGFCVCTQFHKLGHRLALTCICCQMQRCAAPLGVRLMQRGPQPHELLDCCSPPMQGSIVQRHPARVFFYVDTVL